MINFNHLEKVSAEEITFLDKNDYEYSIKDVESLFLELQVTDGIMELELMDCIKHMSIEDFLEEFGSEFSEIMTGFAQFYPIEFEQFSTLTEVI